MQFIAKDGSCLASLIQFAVPICQEAQRRSPRKGRGRPPKIPDWVMAVLIVVAVIKQRKSKSSQYRFLLAHQSMLLRCLGTDHFPSRTTYFDRYKRAWRLYESAIAVVGEKAVNEQLAAARCVAVDKSVINAQGPKWNKRHVARQTVPRAADMEATWTFSKHHGWTLGYGFEVVVSTGKKQAIWPLIASAGAASWQPPRTFPSKVAKLPNCTKYIVADTGYESNKLADAVEFDTNGCRTGRRLLCPYTSGRVGQKTSPHKENSKRKACRMRRKARAEFFQRPFAKRLMRSRGTCVEPFNDWLKTRFDLHHRAWHRGLENNQTQMLAAIFGYQILLFYNHACGNRNGCIQWIIDML